MTRFQTSASSLQILLLGGALLGLASCSASRVSMVVPAPLAAAAPLPVTGKQGFRHSYQFGEFATVRVKQGWLSTSSWGFGSWLAPVWLDQTRAKQKSSFTMQPVAGTTWQARCAYFSHSDDMRVMPGPNSRTSISLYSEEMFSSVIQAPNQPVWQLLLESKNQLGDRPQFARGTLSNGDYWLEVRPISQLLRRDGRPMNMPFGAPVGYEFVEADGAVVAAVELMGRGRVWVEPTLTPALKGPVATAVTAMLIRQQAM
ncbi:hypothetical protein EJV47_02315 [Hymenobacter gummosus]|uniref:Uncharacterized protein n=1 Tax=Hymenobacter gummosus TaxID=1776032 RepID=A0A431U8M4_9BACT|nr:hypothetical protein [Hymenobacter gummosus]RTQ53593.1 hypothetical protein EJV47_02315 [Hymenobacter gummosus]